VIDPVSSDLPVAASARSRLRLPALGSIRLVSALRVAMIVVLLIAIAKTPGFLSTPSLLALVTTVSFVGCVAVGMTLITISGNIMSFALGATVGASAIVFVIALNAFGTIPGIVVALAFGALLTGAQGLAVGWFGANPVIVSIGSLALIIGLAQPITHNATFYTEPGSGAALLKGQIGGVPVEFLVFLGILAIGEFILRLTSFGRNLYMLGNSRRAAEAIGISVTRSVVGAYLCAGAFAAAAGIMLAARYDSANMQYGLGYDYDAIAAVLVGGTAIQGGEGSALRTLLGVMVIAVIQVLLLLQGLRQEWQYLMTGIIVLLVIMAQTNLGKR
jgi:ribose/xylose/arabinose/galactoside ABC-type transport system permease subunit